MKSLNSSPLVQQLAGIRNQASSFEDLDYCCRNWLEGECAGIAVDLTSCDIDFDRLAVANRIHRVRTNQGWEGGVEAITVVYSGEGFGYYGPQTALLKASHSLFPGGATTPICPGNNNVVWLNAIGKAWVQIF